MSVFFLVIMVIWAGAHYYVGQRLITRHELSRPAHILGWSLVWGHLLLNLGTSGLSRAAPGLPGEDALNLINYVSLGAFFLLFFLVLARDAARAALWLVQRINGALQQRADEGIEPDAARDDTPQLSRRAFLGSASSVGILATTGTATAVGYVEARRIPEVERVKVPIANLHPDLEGFRIVQLSDLHIGPTLKRDFLEAVIARVNTLDADLVAMTGDMIDGKVAQRRDDLAPLRGDTVQARHGTFWVTGNHEYYWDGPAWVEEARRMGLRVLVNDHEVITHGAAKLLVGGVTDLRAGRHVPEHTSSPRKAMDGAPPTDLRLLLAHQPGSIYEAAEAGFDLQLSGHTHGGQFYPWSFFVGLAHPFSRGLHRFKKKMWIYVSRGTGYWGPPLRLGASSEITLLELTRA